MIWPYGHNYRGLFYPNLFLAVTMVSHKNHLKTEGILQPFHGQDLTSAASPAVGSRFWRIGRWMPHGGA